ncbi:MAG: cob(I)yrinic acid a,c-diamide adenosyltransferase [Candidatus Micrarchaeota archaeon]
MKLYTKTGDAGETSLANGIRLPKASLRIAAIGDVDELNSFVGLARCSCKDGGEDALLKEVQCNLFTIGAVLAKAQTAKPIEKTNVEKLEKATDDAWQKAGELHNFILPAGSEYACKLHVCRSVCRRVERTVIALGEKEQINDELKIYLNRLSSLFFALARKANVEAGVKEETLK